MSILQGMVANERIQPFSRFVLRPFYPLILHSAGRQRIGGEVLPSGNVIDQVPPVDHLGGGGQRSGNVRQAG